MKPGGFQIDGDEIVQAQARQDVPHVGQRPQCRPQRHRVVAPLKRFSHRLRGNGGDLRVLGLDPAVDGSRIRARLGVVPQEDTLDTELTVWDNLMLAAQSREARVPFHPMAWLSLAAKQQAVRERAEKAMVMAGLGAYQSWVAANLNHGAQRQLEIAMVLATEPEVLLLDEPLAGMGAAEAETMVALLQQLKQGHAMLLVEHDMDAVFALADVLTVMVNGTVIATGTPQDIRADAKVQAAYLGEASA